MKKRMIAMLLCVLMALSSMGGAVFAAEEPVPSVDEFEVVDPHPLEGTVTEDVPEEAETPEIEETLPTEEPTAAEPPAEEETEPEPTEDSMNSGVLDMEDNLVVGQVSAPLITVTPGMTYEELVTAMLALPENNIVETQSGIASRTAATQAVARFATISDPTAFSNEYRTESEYYQNLINIDYCPNQAERLASVAISQLGYADGSHNHSLTGESEAPNHEDESYSEYGWLHGLEEHDWNAMFVSWCARKAGIDYSLIPAFTVTTPGVFGTELTDFENIRIGDILYIFEGGNYRVGIVVRVDLENDIIHTVEGARGDTDKVMNSQYPYTDSRLWSYIDIDYPYGYWEEIDNIWYFKNSETNEPYTGRITVYGYEYYMDPTSTPVGAMATGWTQIGNIWYYFRPSANNNGPEGSLVEGWVSTGSYWYYMDPNYNGAMATGWRSIYSYGKSGYYSAGYYNYYFDANGHMLTGWQNVGTDWYYLRPADNANGPQGSMATGWIPSGDFWYYTDPLNDGAMVLGWKDINGERYYFSPESANYGQMVTGTQVIDGVTYVFDDDGALIS